MASHPETPAVAVDDRWNLAIKTPMGEQRVTLTITSAGQGIFTGVMVGPDGENRIKDGKTSGNRLSWKVDLKKPIKMTLKFDVEINDDALTGTFKPGIFPTGQVTGVRG